MTNLAERIGRLESALEGIKGTIDGLKAAIDGLRHAQNIAAAFGAIAAGAIVGFGLYGLNRLDQLTDRVSEMPARISADLRDISKTLAENITAAKQTPPQVILLPAPIAPAPPRQP